MDIVKEILVRARELISAPERWAWMQLAVDEEANLVGSLSEKARRWSAWGAVERAEFELFNDSYPNMALIRLRKAMDGDVRLFNNTHTHEEVLNAFDKAIQEEL